MNSERNKPEQATVGSKSSEKSSTALVILFVLLAVGAYSSTYYLERHSGGFNPSVGEPYPDNAFMVKYPAYGTPTTPEALGKVVFEKNCAICHQATGLGLPGQFPPLAGSEWVLASKPDRVIRIVLNGLQGPITVKGQPYNGAMFAFKDMPLSDADIANALTYIRSAWGNKAPVVKPEQVKAIRAEVSSRLPPWSAPELEKISVE